MRMNMFGQKKKEIAWLRAKILELEAENEQLEDATKKQAAEHAELKAAVELCGPRKVIDALASLQYKKWMDTEWCRYAYENPDVKL